MPKNQYAVYLFEFKLTIKCYIKLTKVQQHTEYMAIKSLFKDLMNIFNNALLSGSIWITGKSVASNYHSCFHALHDLYPISQQLQ